VPHLSSSVMRFSHKKVSFTLTLSFVYVTKISLIPGSQYCYVMVLAGELHIPFNVCALVIRRELKFWRIDENLIEKCCWDRYCNQVC